MNLEAAARAAAGSSSSSTSAAAAAAGGATSFASAESSALSDAYAEMEAVWQQLSLRDSQATGADGYEAIWEGLKGGDDDDADSNLASSHGTPPSDGRYAADTWQVIMRRLGISYGRMVRGCRRLRMMRTRHTDSTNTILISAARDSLREVHSYSAMATCARRCSC